MRFAYAHGFASGPLSKKGLRLRAAFGERGQTLVLPDLNAPSFARLSLSAMLGVLDRLDATERWGLVGSSLGGWVAARFAELRPERVERLMLLCPAFDLCSRWPAMLPPGSMERWRADGVLVMPDGAGVPTPVHHGFYEEACEQPARPHARCPTLLVHGTRDDRVPIEGSRQHAAAHANVELVEVDDGHDLLASQERIVDLALRFFLG